MKQAVHGNIAIPALLLAVLVMVSGCASVSEERPGEYTDSMDKDAGSAGSGGTSPGDPEAADESRRDHDAPAPAEAPAGTVAETLVPVPEGSAEGAAAGLRESTAGARDDLGFAASGESGLSASFADDNEQYGYFIDFLAEYSWANHLELDVSERIVLHLRDRDGKSVPNADVTISADDGGLQIIETGRSLADGSYQFNPSLYSDSFDRYVARVESSAGSDSVEFARDGARTIEYAFPASRSLPREIPLDIVFVLDTTGSMGEEIERLKRTIELIHLNLTSMSVPTKLRFGLVLYRDLGDSYRTATVPLTSNLQEFQSNLNVVTASGGGDTPEDLQAALEETVRNIDWNTSGLRLSFVITDAPPHLDYGQTYDYTHASRDAREAGMKIFCVGTGGLDLSGEYILRQIAQFTGGAYIFLTYGEEGESEGGVPGSVSHHTGTNFQTDRLETIIIRLAKEELSHLTDIPAEETEGYFTARKIDTEAREETLAALFGQSVDQLIDFSTIAVPRDTVVAVLPISPGADDLRANSEYFSEQLILAASRSERIALVDRQNLQDLLEEQKIQLSGITDSATVVRIGALMNVKMLVVGNLYGGDSYELFLKLVRVETGEVLSVTKAVIERTLGIGDGS